MLRVPAGRVMAEMSCDLNGSGTGCKMIVASVFLLDSQILQDDLWRTIAGPLVQCDARLLLRTHSLFFAVEFSTVGSRVCRRDRGRYRLWRLMRYLFNLRRTSRGCHTSVARRFDSSRESSRLGVSPTPILPVFVKL